MVWIKTSLLYKQYSYLGNGEKNEIVSPTDDDLPSLDLNNLFKYAAPKAIDRIMAGQECSSDVAYAILFKKWLQELELDMTHPALALFWAIYEALGVKNG